MQIRCYKGGGTKMHKFIWESSVYKCYNIILRASIIDRKTKRLKSCEILLIKSLES